MKFLREPLVHFLFIGTALFLLYGTFAKPAPAETDLTLIVSADEIEWMQTSWQQSWDRPPTPDELDRLIQQYVRETVLYREAVALGLDKNDDVIRRRLAQVMEFVAKDPVSLEPPTDEVLRAYFEKHRDRYRQPTRYTFTQVFLDPDKRAGTAPEDAEAIKAKLTARGDNLEDVGSLGDDSALQHHYPKKDRATIARRFGGRFAESLVDLSPRQWHGPLESDYGLHLVYVSEVVASPPPVLDTVHDRVVQDWAAAKSQESEERFYANLLKRYTIVIEEPVTGDKATETPEPLR